MRGSFIHAKTLVALTVSLAALLPMSAAAQSFIQVAAGANHTCAVQADNSVQCWGSNASSQLGGADTSVVLGSPRTVVGLPPTTQVVAGEAHSCALTVAVGVFCWGRNSSGQAGIPLPAVVVLSEPNGIGGALLGAAAGMLQLAAGLRHTCLLRDSGQVFCWGDNASGQFGNGSTTGGAVFATATGINSAIAVSAGSGHTCAILFNGTVKCWGANYAGQLGNGTTSSTATTLPQTVSGLSGASSISAGADHTCAVSAGQVRCWGSGSNGQIGQTSQSTIPVTVPGITDAVAVAAGDGHTCARLATGALKCWGDSRDGQLGDSSANGGSRIVATPFTVPNLSGVTYVAATYRRSCAIASGKLLCWGNNEQGAVGNNTRLRSSLPVRTGGFTDALQVAASIDAACVRHANGRVSCWGDNFYGQLGVGGTVRALAAPQLLSAVTNVRHLAGGDQHFCAALNTGQVQCWGNNGYGQAGGADVSARGPFIVSGISSALAVSAGEHHSCALLSTGGIRCWGRGNFGQLGNGAIGGGFFTATPVDVINLGGTASAISSGSGHTCALVGTGVRCWGDNATYQLGTGSTAVSAQPISPLGLAPATTIGAGGGTSCTVGADSRVSCWGANNVNQAFNFQSTSPVTQPQIAAIMQLRKAVAQGGDSFGCAIDLVGGVTCAGKNDSGQLGVGTTTPTSAAWAFRVNGLDSVTDLALGRTFACARKSNGTVWCWGSNYSGELGDERGLQNNATPQFVSDALCSLDIDDDGLISPQTDGLLLARALFGLTGTSVTQNALGASARRNDWRAIRAHLLQACSVGGLAN